MRRLTIPFGLLAITFGSAHAEDVRLPVLVSELRVYQQVSLTPSAQADYDRLMSDGFFSAFAMAPDGAYGYSTGNNTLAVAQRDALAYCASSVSNPTMVCTLLAESVPQGYQDGDPVSLGQANTEPYLDYLRLAGAKAFAANDGRTVGWAYGYDTISNAEARALQECESVRMQNPDPIGSSNPCRVITSSP